jgi:putative ABC transport system ATP-binding protein
VTNNNFQSPLQSSQAEMASHAISVDRQHQENGARDLPVIAIRELKKTYLLGQTQVHALRGVTFKVYPGEFVAVMGPSGSGKSTLMNLIGCLDRPTSGDYWLTGVSVSRMSADRLAYIRNRRIGFVFQGFQLLPRDTARSNIMLPMVYAGFSTQEQERRARKALQLVGLKAWANHLPSQLSGGQQQRIAIARALVNSPALLLADEPTGNLDTRTSIEIMTVLRALNERGITIIVVTHNAEVAAYARRKIVLRDGRVTSDEAVAASNTVSTDWPVETREAPESGGVQIQEEQTHE